MIFTRTTLHRITMSLLFLIILSGQITAQKNPVSIKGIVQDSAAGKPLPFATVGLYRATNHEKPIRNVFTDSKGRYEFTKVDTGLYVIYASNSGFREKSTASFSISTDSVYEIMPLQLATAHQDLAVVTVSARRPLIEQSEDKLIYNADADPSNDGQMATDVLRKTPFLTVDGDGNVLLNGQSNFKVLLNGRETAMFARNLKETLQAFPANLIKSIEVITSPSAKYDGEGVGGVINIITRKKVMGYNGHINIGRNFQWRRTNPSASFNFKYGKIGFTSNFGMSISQDMTNTSANITESLRPIAFYKRQSYSTRIGRNRHYFGNAELSYEFDSLHAVSMYANINGGRGTNRNYRDIGIITVDKQDTIQSAFRDTSSFYWPTINWGIDFIKKFKKPEQELTLKMYHEKSRDNPVMRNAQYHPDYSRFFLNNNYNTNLQSTYQADFIYPIAKKQRIELGLKGIFRRATADYQSRTRYGLDVPFELDSSNSDKFNYRQNVLSSYLSYKFSVSKFVVRLGVRLENTVIDGEFRTSGTAVNQHYTTWIPNVLITRKLNAVHTLSLSYTKRLSRPYIWDLNPFINNTDSLNLSFGNPDLNPELTHVVELGYTAIKGKTNINIKLTQSYSNTQIVRFASFDDKTGITSRTSDNLGTTYYTTLSGNTTFWFGNKWRFSNGLGLRYDEIENRFNPNLRQSGFGGWINFNYNFDATTKLAVYTNVDLYRGQVYIQGRSANNVWYTVGSRYKFLKEKLILAFNVHNWFRANNTWRNVNADANFINTNVSVGPARCITMNIRWVFGKLTENVSRKRGINNDDLRSNSNN